MKNDKTKIYDRESLKPVHKKFSEKDEFSRYEVVPADGESECSVDIYEIPPGKANYPYHYHESSEEIFYIISGEGIVETEEGDKKLKAGDVIVCPPSPSGAHRIKNISEKEKLVYIEFDTISYPEVAHYPKTNALAVLYAEAERNQFFKEDSKVSYEDEVLSDEE